MCSRIAVFAPSESLPRCVHSWQLYPAPFSRNTSVNMDAAVRLCSIVAVAITVYALQIRSTRRPKRLLSDTSARLLAHGQRRLVSRLLDVGGFFGVDIGGTLTKLVFFAPDKDLIGRILKRVSPAHAAEAEWHTKLASIQQLEHFILSRTIYGGTGVRDARLSFHMAELGGSFHFIRFETRRMDGAMQMAAKSRLNAGMHTMFATGGGSMKVRSMTKRAHPVLQSSHSFHRRCSLLMLRPACLVFT